jgi:hypothetical protein
MKPKMEQSPSINHEELVTTGEGGHSSEEDSVINRRSAEAERRVANLEAKAEKGMLGVSKHSTKFIIEKEVVTAANSDTDVQFAVQNFTVARSNPDAPFRYFTIKDLSNTSKVEVLMRTDTGLEKVGLPDEMHMMP